MGRSFDTGFLRNIIAYDTSGNVGLGGAVDATYKLKVTGSAGFSNSVTAIRGSDNPSFIAIGSNNGNGKIQISGSSNYMIGGGTDYGGMTMIVGGSDRLYILNNGNVGIGTSSPSDKLTIFETGGTTTSTIKLDSNGNTIKGHLGIFNNNFYITSNWFYNGSQNADSLSYGQAAITLETNTASGNILFQTSSAGATNPTERMRITANGNINFNGTVYDNTAVATTRTLYIGSDYRIGGISSVRASKKNIESISSVDWIYQLNPVTFNYRKKDEDKQYTDEVYDELVYGLIAEDTEPIADFLINYNDKKEMIGIEYSRLITPMLKAIQELKAEIDILKAK